MKWIYPSGDSAPFGGLPFQAPYRLSLPNELHLNPVEIRPLVQSVGGELWPIVHPIQDLHDPLADDAVSPTSLDFFCQHILKHLFVKAQIRHQILELPILFFNLLEPVHLRYPHPRKFPLPAT